MNPITEKLEFLVRGIAPDGKSVTAKVRGTSLPTVIEALRRQGWQSVVDACEPVVVIEQIEEVDKPIKKPNHVNTTPQNDFRNDTGRNIDSGTVREGEFSGWFSNTKWIVTKRAIKFETTYGPPFDTWLTTNEKTFSLTGVHTADAVSAAAWLWETRGFYVVIMFPLVLVIFLLAIVFGDANAHLVALRMNSGNTIWLNNEATYSPVSANEIADAIRSSISQ
jgi:hypothetical protein